MSAQRRPSEEPVLTVPFRLRGGEGRVRVYFGPNEDPDGWGFGLLSLPFPVERARGFPVFLAEVDHEAQGYAAVLGWSQVLFIEFRDGTPAWSGLDRAPTADSAAPADFAYRPSLFDAPGPNPPRQDERWQAQSWLLACPTAMRTREAAPILGIGWGYDISPAGVTLLFPWALVSADWARAQSVLQSACPGWRFRGLGETA